MIGVSAVIILLAVGTGSSQAVQDRIKAARHEHDHGAQPRPVRRAARRRPGRSRRTRRSRTPSVTAIEDPSQAPDVASGLAGRLDDRDRDLRRGELLDLGDRHDARLPRRPRTTRSRPAARSRRSDVTNRRRVVLVGQTVAQQPLRDRPEPARADDPARLGELPDRRRARREGNLGDDEPGQRRDRAVHRGAGRAHRASRRRSASCSSRRSRRRASTTPRPRSRRSSPPRTTRPSRTCRSRSSTRGRCSRPRSRPRAPSRRCSAPSRRSRCSSAGSA